MQRSVAAWRSDNPAEEPFGKARAQRSPEERPRGISRTRLMLGFVAGAGTFIAALAGLHGRGMLSESAVTWTSIFTLMGGTAGLAAWIHNTPKGRAIDTNETFWGLMILIPGALMAITLLVDGSLRREALTEGSKLSWIVLLVEVVGSGIVLALRTQRLGCEERRRQAFHWLTAEVAFGELLDNAGVLAWLDRHWPVPSSAADLHESRDEYAVAGRVRGYPVLIDVEPRGRSDDPTGVPPRALVLLATRLPARFANSPTAADLRATLARDGFELECYEDAGLLARATDTGRAAIQADPPRLESLPAVADQLAYAVSNSGSIALTVPLGQLR